MPARARRRVRRRDARESASRARNEGADDGGRDAREGGDVRRRSVGGSVVVASARETRRRGFIRAFIRSRGGRLNFERARGGARLDVEDA